MWQLYSEGVQESIPGVCVICVQDIAEWRREMGDPSTDEGRRARLERHVQDHETSIQSLIASDDVRISQHEEAISSLQGELSGVAVPIFCCHGYYLMMSSATKIMLPVWVVLIVQGTLVALGSSVSGLVSRHCD